jgi:hypothetical protein
MKKIMLCFCFAFAVVCYSSAVGNCIEYSRECKDAKKEYSSALIKCLSTRGYRDCQVALDANHEAVSVCGGSRIFAMLTQMQIKG